MLLIFLFFYPFAIPSKTIRYEILSFVNYHKSHFCWIPFAQAICFYAFIVILSFLYKSFYYCFFKQLKGLILSAVILNACVFFPPSNKYVLFCGFHILAVLLLHLLFLKTNNVHILVLFVAILIGKEMIDPTCLFDSEEEEEDESKKKSPEERKFLFRKELRAMLYGFGDEKNPSDDTLEVLEQIVTDYVKDVCKKALAVGKPNRVSLEDIHYLIRRDQKKFSRVKELLSLSEELKKARKVFDEAAKDYV